MPRGGRETPGERDERERRARQDQDRIELNAQRRKESHQKQKDRIEAARKYRESLAARERQAAARGSSASGGAASAPARYGQNEAAVYEYLKRHPQARLDEVAYRAIYGGGPVAWEGLHRKTRKNAEDEAARVVSRLKAEGKIKVTGYTLGGKPKYAAVGDTPTADESGKPFYEKGRKGKVTGRDEPQSGATDKGSGGLGVFNAPGGSGGGGDQGGDSGGGVGGLIFNTDSNDDPSDDDDGGGHGVFKGF